MTSSRPYLLRAIYQWVVDNNHTPHMLVDASGEDVQVPTQFVQDGRIVLNVAPQAVQALNLGDEYVSFSARFAGRAQEVFVPVQRVMAVYSRENGQGMMFGDDDTSPPSGGPGGTTEPRPNGPSSGRPGLRVVK
ncbi:ClpXP protease specificity-enhancing factor [Acidihalobacter yilgarnensis]|uniref:ClpXP protease specificity-enhancing factor n=1 Tax=Acidihalobacter yilgarnensis TaxID=2819280 RepID=A0A1D8ITC2_9GAMM|nr:ClpXP protease specificity-enhancing factor [Acidihalobacter yilgarnensis]AOU99772.1 ClpXP protease specificity-enhancing factor [Acidihalobacter yilgarnensis]